MRRNTVTIAVVLAAAGGVALAHYPDWSARAAVARLLADHPGLQVGGAEVSFAGDRIVLRDVSLQSGGTRVSARRISLALSPPRFQLVGSALAQAGTPVANTASAAGVTVVRGATTYTAKTIDLAGTTLSNADLAALLDPKSPDPLAARLGKVNADTIALSEVAATRKGAEGEARATLAQVVLSKVADGKIGTVTAASGAAAATGPHRDTTLKTGAIQAAGVDLLLLERIADAVRTDEAEPLKPLADALTVHDLALVDAGRKTSVAVAAITQKGLRARPLKTELAQLDAPGTGDPVTDQAARAERLKAFLDDFGGSVAVSAFTLDRATLSNADPDGPGRLAVAALALEDYRDRRIGAVRASDFAFEGPSARLGFASLAVADIVFPPPGAGDPAALATDAFPSTSKADMTDIAVDIATPQGDAPPPKLRFRVAHVGTTAERQPDRFPARGAIAVDHVTFDLPDSDSPGVRDLLAMGYRQMDLSGGVTSSYDRATQTLSVQKLLVSGVGMGSATLAMDLSNVSQAILSANAALARASALAMLLKRVDLRLANDGLVDKALAFRAKLDGKSLADERKAVGDLFAESLPQALGNGAGIRALGAAVASFVADPKTLHVSLASHDGLGASDIGLIGSPDDLLSRLDIQAEANK